MSGSDRQPSRAQVVVIGGGVVGCSVAYHLAALGLTDVVLLEQGALSCGTTWHAAGIIGQVRATSSMTRLARYSIELYSQLEAETGFATGWRQCGALWVARTEERVTHLQRAISQARAFGSLAELISPREAKQRYPLLNADDLKAAVWLPEDGTANPTDLTQSLARGAAARGVRIIERTKVISVDAVADSVRSVTTAAGVIECETVVIAAGQWSKAIGDTIGVTIPLHAAQHFYAVTEPIEGMERGAPILRDPDGHVYFKEEVGGLLAGSFEPDALPWVRSRDIPEPFEFQLIDENWEHFAPMMEFAAHRVPVLAGAGIKKLYNGPESFTPDNNFLLGAAPEVGGVFVAAGFNSGGIANAGGAGLALAEWIIEGEPTRDLWSVDVARFAPFARSDSWLRSRTIETLGIHYALPWPNRELESGRGVRRSPVYHLLERAGACFGARLGWERANWFAGPGSSPEVRYSFGRQNWHERVAEEHQATRERVAIFDQTSFAKFLVQGANAEEALQLLCANDVAVAVGGVVYTAMLNDRGGFETDLTITRTGDEEFLVVTGSAQQIRDLAYLRKHLSADWTVTVTDVTSGYAVFGVMGPKSRELLSRVSDADFSPLAFRFATSRLVDLGIAQVRATRMTYVGELGWELYIPTEYAVAVYEKLLEAGEDLGITPAGYYAIDCLRLEKGYRAWGRDLTPDITLIEAGLTKFSKLDSDIPFRGRCALEKQLHEPLVQQLIEFQVEDPDVDLWGAEVLLLGDKIIGTVTSAAFGHTVGAAVGIGLVNAPRDSFAWDRCTDLWVDLGGKRAKVLVRTEAS
jgi:glycine cleavage system aminomethyltransferase T/glycine/D-amino acid oxidase-like deaminating enzyme